MSIGTTRVAIRPGGPVAEAMASAVSEATVFEDVAVLTVSWDGKTEELLELLRRALHPSFRIVPAGPVELVLKIL